MNANTISQQPKKQTDLRRGVAQRGAQVLIILLIYAALLFGSAGALDWTAAWAYVAVYVVTVLVNMSILLPRSPEFIAARGQVKEDTKGWDKQLTNLAGLFMILGLVIPGLDVRFGWSPEFGRVIQSAGLIGLALGSALFSWAMLSNQFFETKVRIQTDRGQTVATSGPYRYVRHPGYVGMIIEILATPVLLGSLYGIVPAVIAAALFVVRTALEDRTLQQELPGYAAYAQRVPFRLLPGVW